MLLPASSKAPNTTPTAATGGEVKLTMEPTFVARNSEPPSRMASTRASALKLKTQPPDTAHAPELGDAQGACDVFEVAAVQMKDPSVLTQTSNLLALQRNGSAAHSSTSVQLV